MTNRMQARLSTRRIQVVSNVADSCMSSGSNLLLTLVVARVSSPRLFGTFALAFAGYLIVLGLSRALSTDPLIVRAPALEKQGIWQRSVRQSCGTALWVGLSGGTILLVLGVPFPGSQFDIFAGFAISMPFLMLQDAWRNVHFAGRRADRALLNDSVWTCGMLVILVVVQLTGKPDAFVAVIAWGVGALAACLIGLLQVKLTPTLRTAKQWLHENRRLWPWYAGEAAVGTGVLQLNTYIVGFIAGVAAAGAVKGATTLVGLVTTLVVGIYSFLVPWFVAHLSNNHGRLALRAIGISSALAIIALAWGLAVLLFPFSWGRDLLGQTWITARPLVLPATIWAAAYGLQAGPISAIRAMQLVTLSFRIRALTAFLLVAGVTVGALFGDALGAMWGFAASMLITSLIWCVALVVVEHKMGKRTRLSEPVPTTQSNPLWIQ